MSEYIAWICRASAIGAGLACGVISFIAVVALLGVAYEAAVKGAAKLYKHIRFKRERRIYEKKRQKMEVLRDE